MLDSYRMENYVRIVVQCKFGAAVLVFCLGVKMNYGKNSMKFEKTHMNDHVTFVLKRLDKRRAY